MAGLDRGERAHEPAFPDFIDAESATMGIEDAVLQIEASADFRLLRRVPQPENWGLGKPSGEVRRALFIDCETTGLDVEIDEVIELALLPFDYERDTGQIISVNADKALSALRQPSQPIPPASVAIHGISDAEVAGRTVSDDQVRALVDPAHLIIAHNAAFDRPMLEKHWPIFVSKHWACSLADIDWKGEGLGSGKLDYLLMKQGWFHDGHRALSDAMAALFLLSRPLPLSGKSGLLTLLESARRPLRAVRAEDTAFEQRAALKQRGYRWDDGEGRRAKAWWILTDDPNKEVAWLQAEIYGDDRSVPVVSVPATRRYSSRLWPD